MRHKLFDTLQDFKMASGRVGQFYSLPALEKAGIAKISRLPVSIRIVLEAILRNCDGRKITEEHVRQLAGWQPNEPRTAEIPFVVARILLQDFTGVPLLCDLAAMRAVASQFGRDPKIIEPLVQVDLVVDHSVQVDHYNSPNALDLNMKLEFQRNAERYKFIKWGMQAFDTFKVVPPGVGIVHQVNLEYLAPGVWQKEGVFYPDSLVGTDSHTTMINGLGVVAWGVGGIEAEAGMLGQPLYLLTPDVIGVHLLGQLGEGVTATDLVLFVTERLRQANVVGKFVEFFGAGAASLTLPDRATIANMAPEYGATMGFFPVDAETIQYLTATGRSAEAVDAVRAYFTAQGMFGMPEPGEIDYSRVLEIDLALIGPCVAGPKRPQDRIALPDLKARFNELLEKPVAENGYGKSSAELGKRFPIKLGAGMVGTLSGGGDQTQESLPDGSSMDRVEMVDNHPTPNKVVEVSERSAGATEPAMDLGHGDVLIAAITSCTNTSNPSVLLAAGLLAKRAVLRGLKVHPRVKTSLAPGSRVVTEYLKDAGLLGYLDRLGFRLVAYGCTTCIGNAGPLDPPLEETIIANDVVAAAVLSGNRNFEARIHQSIKANFLMSPPLVVAFALAGTLRIDMSRDPIGLGHDGQPVYLKDIWPTQREIADLMHYATNPETYRRLYADFSREKDNSLWNAIPSTGGPAYTWGASTYIAEPPFFKDFSMRPGKTGDIKGARALAIFGDSVTTDHISPAGSIKPSSPAGEYLHANGVATIDFNSYGSRRGNHEVMMRGTFANVRIKNLMLPQREGGAPAEGGNTLLQPAGLPMTIFKAAMSYIGQGTPTLVFAGEEYGTGSSRDWAAKGTLLLGVKAVIAQSFERIHRSNLVGMGVLPLQFIGGDGARPLAIRGDELFDITGLEGGIRPQQEVVLAITRRDGSRQEAKLLLRIDTPIEVDYFLNGGILPYVLRELLAV